MRASNLAQIPRNSLKLICRPLSHRFPTYPLVLGLKGDNPSIANFAAAREGSSPTPGLPVLDPKKLVHAEQSIEILGDLPKESGEGWTIQKKLVGIKETGKGVRSLSLFWSRFTGTLS